MKLNIGCGPDIRPGWVNMDREPMPGVLQHDLMNIPWPFPDECFEVVYASHVLEHLPHCLHNGHASTKNPFVEVLDEIWRILIPGKMLIVKVPYWNTNVWDEEPTHARRIHDKTWSYLRPDGGSHWLTKRYFQLVDIRRDYAPRFETRLTWYLAKNAPILIRSIVGKPWESTYVLQKEGQLP